MSLLRRESTLGRIDSLLTLESVSDAPVERVHAAFNELRALVKFPRGGVLRFSPTDWAISIACNFELDGELTTQYLDHFWEQDPFVTDLPCLAAPNRAVQLADFVDLARITRTEFGDFMLKASYFHPIAVTPFVRGMPFGAVALHRAKRDGPFSENDRWTLEWFAARVAECYERAEFLQRNSNEASGFFVLGPQGELIAISEQALFVLSQIPPGTPVAIPTPQHPTSYFVSSKGVLGLTAYQPGKRSLLPYVGAKQWRMGSATKGLSGKLTINAPVSRQPFVVVIEPLSGLREVRAHLDLIGLTKREKEIVLLLLRGPSNKAVASQLNITLQTLKEHLNHVYRKASVKNRDQLVARLLGTTLGS